MDRRRLASNGRVAHVSLKGQVEAERFVAGEVLRICAPDADLRCDPDGHGLDRQLLHGDRFLVLERIGKRAFGKAERGGYVGYLYDCQLDDWVEPNAYVHSRATFGFSVPDFKYPDPPQFSLGSRVTVLGREGRFSQTVDGYFIPTAHLSPVEQVEPDPVSVAERLIGTPYLWGGNTSYGIDCSGLVQIGMDLCGIDCPGDSDLQEAELGTPLADDVPLQRGDLLFWKGHVAMVVDGERLIHANAHHMAVAYEGIDAAISRIERQGDGPVTARKRLEGLGHE